ncbi:hypothetical protein OEW28_18640 [Defluviimonas sp. WL0002]|uniref:Tail assembly chaperone n=1 Tax=Albidovulum marisflavi TaxID=2984159 RepID=A0ABT2ZHM3_9RHOB|nr:hypothetical protein [Defluviimonas sp. WL0002]MCV2870635.1 hypothetical protein [Defluviimonas sp. WL0002]
MLRLKINRAPEWVDLARGVRVQVSPVTSSVMVAARSDIAALPEGLDPGVVSVALTKAIARRVVIDWDGVGDEDENPIGVSEAAVDALIDLHLMCEAFNARVLWPYLELQREKNASSPSPNGISAGAEATAQTAFRSARSAQES